MEETRSDRLRKGSQERRAQQRQELRQAILTTAAALFLEHGYAGFSLRQVAEQIGYSATTIYLYFASKDELLFTIADEGFAHFQRLLDAASAGPGDDLAALARIGRAYISFGLAQPAHYRLMFMERADFLLGCRAGERAPRVSALNIVEQHIRAGIAAGIIRPGPPTALADALWAAVHGVVAMHVAAPLFDRPRAEAAAEAALQLIIAGLCNA